MRKGVAYLFRYRDVSRSANARYLDALAVATAIQVREINFPQLLRARPQRPEARGAWDRCPRPQAYLARSRGAGT
jgi:hypothetical protein